MPRARIAIVTDSTAFIPQELIEQYDIRVIPLHLIWSQETQLDGVTGTPAHFYQRLASSDSLPTTSQPSAGEFIKVFTEAAYEAEAIVSIHISSELSGTVNSAREAQVLMSSKLPIRVIDSRSTTMGLGFMALAAARAAQAGGTLDQVTTAVEQVKACINVLFVVETLEYLHKGGRIGGASALLGSVLRIRPILHLDDGRIELLEKVRSSGKAIRGLLDRTIEQLEGKQGIHVAVIHADALDIANGVFEEVKAKINCDELIMAEFSPVIGTHLGPGTIALVFYHDEKRNG